MENVISGRRHTVNRTQIKNVMIKHLHSVYFCKVYVLEYLEQTKAKVRNKELQKLVDQIVLVLKEHIGILDQFYAKLHVQPDNAYMSGLRSYTQEAMMVFQLESKTQFEKELVMLSYLDVISAINATQIRMLDRMVRSLNIPDNHFKTFIAGCVEIGNDIEKLAGSYLG